MIVTPKVRGFICTTAHPAGLNALVEKDVSAADAAGKRGPKKRALIVGSSMGYGLASRIALLSGYDADTVGVHLDRPSAPEQNKTGTAGWYNTISFERIARERGVFAQSINGDAFSDETKDAAIALIREKLGQVDVVIHSLASPVRKHPETGVLHRSAIKAIGDARRSKTVDVNSGAVSEVEIPVATEQEIADTVAVMGGDDMLRWVKRLSGAGVLASGCRLVAYSYIGPQLTHAVYKDGAIGKAKDDVMRAISEADAKLREISGGAYLSINKSLVTQASSAIPVLPLYIALVYKVMKEKGLHEGCLEQAVRLFTPEFFSGTMPTDDEGRIRLDDLELLPQVQQRVLELWNIASTDNIAQIADLDGYKQDFMNIFGFAVPGVDYSAEVEI